MRTLSATLLAAQQKASARPMVKVTAANISGGVPRLDWERLYQGGEDDYFHALSMAENGSLVRCMVKTPADARKLYRQTVASPGPGSDFSAWTYTGQYNTVAIASAACGNEISIIWIRTTREIRRIVSTDGGASWSGSQLIDYTLTTAISGLTAAYRPDGDLALFWTEQSTVFVKQQSDGVWQTRVGWGKSTGDLNGIACAYRGDWDLLVSGEDTSGNPRIWSLVYGDGDEVPLGTWSDLTEIITAKAGGDYSYRQPFLDTQDAVRCSYLEEFSGNQAVTRPFLSYTLPGSAFVENLWREPVPLDVTGDFGLALAHDDTWAWASCPSGVWRALRTSQEIDISADISVLRQVSEPESGSLEAALRNDDAGYAAPGTGDLTVLVPGCRIRVSPGYLTHAGAEYSDGPGFRLESCEHVSGGGKASLILHGKDGWTALREWQARQQFRWNAGGDHYTVRDIMAVILARAGLKLETVSASESITGLYPDFTVSPGTDGRTAVFRLLAFVPDMLFCEDETMFIVNPLQDDPAGYGYGDVHRVVQSSHITAGMRTNRVEVEGYNAVAGSRILVESAAWKESGRFPSRTAHVGDRNIGTVAAAGELGQSVLRKSAVSAVSGELVVPVNCGQQLYDVIEITDTGAGLDGEPRRVLGITFAWNPGRGEYTQRLRLGAV